MLTEILDTPHDFWDHLKRFTTSIGSTVTYGFRVPVLNTQEVTELFAVCACPIVSHPGLEDLMPGRDSGSTDFRFCKREVRSLIATQY
jgi:hypothetical protein